MLCRGRIYYNILECGARCTRMRGNNALECRGEQYTLALAHFAIDFALPPFSSLSLAMPEFTPAPRLTLHTFFSLSDADVTDVERGGM